MNNNKVICSKCKKAVSKYICSYQTSNFSESTKEILSSEDLEIICPDCKLEANP